MPPCLTNSKRLAGVNMESDDEGSESDSQLGLDIPDDDVSDDEDSNAKEEEAALKKAREEQLEMMRTISPVNEGNSKSDPQARLQVRGSLFGESLF